MFPVGRLECTGEEYVGSRIGSADDIVAEELADFDFIYLMAAPQWKAGDFDLTQEEIDRKYVDGYAYAGYPYIEKFIDTVHKTGGKVLCSFPGMEFIDIASSEERSLKFARMMARLVREYDYDGIELDWEHTITEELHLKFMQKIRKELDAVSEGRRQYWLTTALHHYRNYTQEQARQLCECVVQQLDMTPVEAQCRACYVIALLCDRFGFRTQPDSLLRLMFDSGSREYRLAAGTAMNSLIKVDPSIADVFLDARRLRKIIKRAPAEDIRMKDILISVIRRTVEHAPGQTVSLLLDVLPQCTDFLTQLMDSDDESMLEDVLVVLANLAWVAASVSADALHAISASVSPSLFALKCSDRLDALRQQICDVFVKI